ncbi:MAG: SRPBCC family protein [Breznakibacter sp.]
MTTFESARYMAVRPASEIYGFISDFNAISVVLPSDKVKNWQSDADSCRFTVDGLGEVGLRISQKEPSTLVQYVGDGKVPFNFYLNVHLSDCESGGTSLYLSAQAQLNPMMKLIATGPIQNFLDKMAEAIAKHYSK